MTKLCHISAPKIMLKSKIIKLTQTASLFIKKSAPIPRTWRKYLQKKGQGP